MTVRIIDATLREGVQTPGVRFTPMQTVQIARGLAVLGVDMIECGHPAVSEAERSRIRALTRLDLGTPVLSHARARVEDVAAVHGCGAGWVGIFLGVNRISRDARVLRPERELLDLIRTSVGHARALGLSVRYTLEDATRTPVDLMMKAYEAASETGADRLCIADTVGVLEPSEVAERVRSLRSAHPTIPVEVHSHNDRGLAIANALAAIDAGASWISTCVNGLGERCGITDLTVLLANLQHRGLRPLRDPDQLHRLSGMVAEFSSVPVEFTHPVVGANAFRHTAALHVQAVQRDPRSYSWTDPALLGCQVKVGPEDP